MADFSKYKNHLLDYLKIKNIKVENGMTRCFAPDHKDKNPSCLITKPIFRCLACGIRGDIYDAIGLIENISDRKAQFAFAEKLFKEAVNA